MKGEAQLQSECVKWFRLAYPDDIIFAIPNGGSRNVVEAYNLKRQGVLAGVPDLFVARQNSNDLMGYGYVIGGLFVEMKYGKGKLTTQQDVMGKKLLEKGYAVAICRTFDEFKNTIDEYFN